MRQVLLSAALILVAASTLMAQGEPDEFRRFDIGFNVASFARIEDMNGWGGQLGFVARLNRKIGVVGDFDVHRNNEIATTDLIGYRVGPRIYGHHGTRLTTFGHFLVGGGQLKQSVTFNGVTSSQSINGFSMLAGGGMDVGIKPWFAIRIGQVDYDYFRFSGIGVDGIRVGGGVVFRMGR
jgi:hypothetical protein